MRRIVIDARESGTTTGRYIDKLVEHLHKLKPSEEIVVLTKPYRLNYIRQIAPNFQAIPCPYKEFTFAEQMGFARQLYKLKASLVHFNAPQQPIFYLRKTVTTVHDLTTLRFNNPGKFWPVYKFKQLVYRFVIQIVAKKSKDILTPSKFVRGDLIDFSNISPKKVTVTYEAADKITEQARPVQSLAGKKFITYAGRPLPHKNLRRLINAFDVLQKNDPDLHLVLIGKKYGPYLSHAKYIEKKQIPNVIFTDFISDGQLRWCYENTRAHIVPSLSEGFGLPGLEAMQAGAPVVSSNATCLPEVYGDAALYFDPKNIDDMAEKISMVLGDKMLRGNLIRRGRAQATRYSWAKMAEQTLGVYRKALS